MLNDENLKDYQAILDSVSKTLDSMECVLDCELEIRGEEIKVEPNIPINRYGLGQTLYLPVKIVGIRSEKSKNGDDIAYYEVRTITNHYMPHVPESYILGHDELAELFKKGII